MLSHYQAQVSEFTEELLVAQEYYKHDPNFWVNSRLVEHWEMEESVFEATRVTSSNFDSLSASETVQQLYEAHSNLLSLLSPALAKAGFDSERCKRGFSCYKQNVKGSGSSPQSCAKGSRGRMTERG